MCVCVGKWEYVFPSVARGLHLVSHRPQQRNQCCDIRNRKSSQHHPGQRPYYRCPGQCPQQENHPGQRPYYRCPGQCPQQDIRSQYRKKTFIPHKQKFLDDPKRLRMVGAWVVQCLNSNSNLSNLKSLKWKESMTLKSNSLASILSLFYAC